MISILHASVKHVLYALMNAFKYFLRFVVISTAVNNDSGHSSSSLFCSYGSILRPFGYGKRNCHFIHFNISKSSVLLASLT
jgi:hypothetical protein